MSADDHLAAVLRGGGHRGGGLVAVEDDRHARAHRAGVRLPRVGVHPAGDVEREDPHAHAVDQAADVPVALVELAVEAGAVDRVNQQVGRGEPLGQVFGVVPVADDRDVHHADPLEHLGGLGRLGVPVGQHDRHVRARLAEPARGDEPVAPVVAPPAEDRDVPPLHVRRPADRCGRGAARVLHQALAAHRIVEGIAFHRLHLFGCQNPHVVSPLSLLCVPAVSSP